MLLSPRGDWPLQLPGVAERGSTPQLVILPGLPFPAQHPASPMQLFTGVASIPQAAPRTSLTHGQEPSLEDMVGEPKRPSAAVPTPDLLQ